MTLELARDGAVLASGAASEIMPDLLGFAATVPQDQAGVRLAGKTALKELLASEGPIARLVRSQAGNAVFPVRALLFDKTAAQNWSLAWHQDRAIVVRQRREVDGFGPWTIKAGLLHVAPPIEVLARMVTVRVHLDPVPADNAPLLIAPRSHRLGRIAEENVPSVVKRCGISTCLAEAGDVWLYSTPILHALEVAHRPKRRRVLQLDYARDTLPGGLAWLGV